MNKNNKKIELLAPAGNMEKMKVALAHGADAVYVGIPDFSLRVRINDFNIARIKEATQYCHKRGKKIYITINIFAHNQHLKNLPQYVKKLKEIKVDALIVSDPGVIGVVRECWPKVEIHLSTQANVTNWQAVKFWRDQGINRIILGREVSLSEIKEIHKKVPEIELEYFVHGAMCMAYSGRCFLSKEFLNRSANLGDCVQPCRWEFVKAKGHDEEFELVEEEHGSYLLNSKDLCLIEHLQELKDAGVVSFKIEGRAKSAYYQAVVAGIYSSATQKNQSFYKKELETKLVHRGFTKGFLFGEKADQNIKNSHEECEWEFCGQVIKSSKPAVVKVHNSLKVGDIIEIIKPKYDIIEMKVEKMYDVDTGNSIKEAHGGQEKTILLEVEAQVPKYSVIRRRI